MAIRDLHLIYIKPRKKEGWVYGGTPVYNLSTQKAEVEDELLRKTQSQNWVNNWKKEKREMEGEDKERKNRNEKEFKKIVTRLNM